MMVAVKGEIAVVGVGGVGDADGGRDDDECKLGGDKGWL